MGKIVFMHCDLDSSDGRTVEGITLVVDGDVKTVLDYILMEKGDEFKSRTEIVNHALIDGLKILTDEIQSSKNENIAPKKK